MQSIYERLYKPDVLSCLADLSNDEVFTPPDIANKMLDLLPQELFKNKDTKILDPACKSGVILREAAKRFIEGERDQFDSLQECIDWVFHNQIYGIAITELTSLLSRRSVYCSKYPNSPFSITKFEPDDVQGNIIFHKIRHTWKNGTCQFCNASQSEYDRPLDLETHAYEFIHVDPEEIWNMKFDVVISNPPYQLSDGGAQASAKPLYHLFVESAKKLNPRYVVMIIPARWYAGGKGLDAFRDAMLDDIHLRELHDFPNTDDCFPGVNIRGGVCYFLWDRAYNNADGLTRVVTHDGDKYDAVDRPMRYEDFDIFLRYNRSLAILTKVMNQCKGNVLMSSVSSRKPFGLGTEFAKGTDFHKSSGDLLVPVKCYAKNKSVGYVERGIITTHKDWVDKWKVYTSRANNIGTELNDDNLNAFLGEPGTICTESYIAIGADLNLDKQQAQNLADYLQTKFVRFFHSLAKASQDATSKTYRFVPSQDFSKSWTDEELYLKYGLTSDEIEFIESMIKPMDVTGGKD